MQTTRFIFVVGGVMSGVGKGISTAATAAVLKSAGFSVSAMKIDPYLNVDAGTMNPTEHGEVFVTRDGLESDQDLGHYERFLSQDIVRENYMTTGTVYQAVIERERALGYGGSCVEVVPHITDEIERRITRVAESQKPDFLLIEIGGTVGEYQNSVYLEAARIMKLKWPDRVGFILVSYFPIPQALGEMKTKPTQNAVRALNAVGIQPDIIVGRASASLDSVRKKKVSVFCNVGPADIISAPDLPSIYDVPLQFSKENILERILEKFNLDQRATPSDGATMLSQDVRPKITILPALALWEKLNARIHIKKPQLRIGIVGKYFGTGDFVLKDSYISVLEALRHGAWAAEREPVLEWLNAQEFTEATAVGISGEKKADSLEKIRSYDGIVVPGGFGSRGVEGKIRVIRFCRENNIPFLGLCYGLQLAVIEFARNVCGLQDAHTTEIDPATAHPVITTMPDQIKKIQQANLGGSMRLGAYTCELAEGSRSLHMYGRKIISERHRHRYEVNPEFTAELVAKGLTISGTNPETGLVEIIESPGPSFFVATQFHPEFQSRPHAPHPLFVGFARAAAIQSVTLPDAVAAKV